MALITIRDNLKSLKLLLEQMEAEAEPKHVKNKPSGSSISSEASNQTAVTSVSANTNNTTQLNAKFKEQMSKFYSVAEESYNALDTKFKVAEKDFETACVLYVEEPKTTTPEEFFGIFSKFCQSYTAAKKENEMALQKELQDKKREEAKKVAEEKMNMKKREKSESNLAVTAGIKEGGLDDLISSIRTGKAFQDKVPRRTSSRGQGAVKPDQDPSESIKKLRQGHNARESVLGKQLSFANADVGVKKPSFQNAEQGAVGRLKRNVERADGKTLAEKLG
jgi:Formin Homology 2 Domain